MILTVVGKKRNELFFNKPLQLSLLHACYTKTSISSALWHFLLGHPSYDMVNKVLGYPSLKSEKQCVVCLHDKKTRDHFSHSLNNTTTIFDLMHYDLWGPYNTPSTCGAIYFLTILDNFSRFVRIYLLSRKERWCIL